GPGFEEKSWIPGRSRVLRPVRTEAGYQQQRGLARSWNSPRSERSTARSFAEHRSIPGIAAAECPNMGSQGRDPREEQPAERSPRGLYSLPRIDVRKDQ